MSRSRSWPLPMQGAGIAIACAVLSVACGKNDENSRPKAGATQGSASAAAPAPTSQVVRLRAFPSKIGREYRVERTMASSLSVEFWQDDDKLGANESSRAESFTRTTRVLGTVGGVPSKVRVTYDEYKVDETPSSGEARHSTLLKGKTYVVDATDSPTRYALEDGKAVPEAELTELKGLHTDTGKVDAIVEILADKPIKVGASGKMSTALLSSLLGTGAGDIEEGTFTLTGRRTENGRDVAIFDFKTTTKTQESGGLEITSHLEGQAVVGVEPAETLSVTVKGALEAGGMARNEHGLMKLQGSGWSKLTKTFTPLAASAP